MKSAYLFPLPSHSYIFNLSNECSKVFWHNKSNCKHLYFTLEFLHSANPLLILLLLALLSSLTSLVLASYHCSLLTSALFGNPILIHSPCQISAFFQHLTSSEVKLLSCVGLLVTPWASAYQAPPIGFSRQEYWSGLPLPVFVLNFSFHGQGKWEMTDRCAALLTSLTVKRDWTQILFVKIPISIP